MATREEVEGGRPPLTHHPSPSHGGRWVISGAFLGAGEQGLIPSVLPHVSPVPKARDADQLDDIDSYLTEKYKEEAKSLTQGVLHGWSNFLFGLPHPFLFPPLRE